MSTSETRGNKVTVYKLAAIGMMSALAFVANQISIPIGDITRIHFGNPFCVLAGLMLGPVGGGVAGGLGGFFYDLTNPIYAAEAPITFLIKFVIGFFAGLVSHSKGHHGDKQSLNILGATVGSLLYVVVYLIKCFILDYVLLHNPMETVMAKLAIKAGSSLTNAVIAIVVSSLLAPIFLRAMKQAGIYKRLYPNAGKTLPNN